MSGVRVIRHWQSVPVGGPQPPLRPTGPLLAPVVPNTTAPEIIAIGASAGGPSALAELFGRLPHNFPLPVVAVQHLTSDFMPGLAQWLDRVCPLPVRLAQHGEKVMPGVALLAPGDQHMRIGADRRIVLDSERGNYRHQPAVDVLLTSVAQRYGPNALGIILTGMGDDGAAGLKAMRDSGARTIAQDESSCVVFGMPGAAIALDAAEFILPLDKIASAIFKLSQRGEEKK
jgi:two-component system chemotaxis response regulator CheB